MSSPLLSLRCPQITQIGLKTLCNLWVSLTVWLFAVATVAGQTSAPATSSGTISGRVVNESGQPLAYATVSLYAIGVLRQENSTTTDRDGKFQLSGLEPRNYRVIAWRSSYATFVSPANHRVGDSVTIVLAKGGVITGTVTTQTGEPVVGVTVRARMINDNSRQFAFPFNVFSLARTTDDRGVYRIYGLRAGTYMVWAGGGGNPGSEIDAFEDFVPTYAPASTRDTAAEISVHAGEEISNVDIRFRGEPGHVISGRISQPKGVQTLASVINLTAVGKNKSEWTMLTVQPEDGRSFAFRGVDDGDYVLTALPFAQDGLSGAIATTRVKVSGADVTGIELTTGLLASVSGRIVLEESNKTECVDKQRPSFTETLVFASQDEVQVTDYHPQLQFFLKGPGTVDANGSVSLKNLVPGRYFFMPEFAAKYWYLQSITLPPVAPATKPVDATRTWSTLKSGDRLSGLTITLAQGAASFSGQVAEDRSEDLFLYLVPAEKERAEDALRFFGAAIGPDRKVALNNLPPGSYWLLVKSTAEGAPVSTAKLRLPDQKELRASLRREAEAAKTTIELKPCQNLIGFQLNVN
jgi:hypothetical protein